MKKIFFLTLLFTIVLWRVEGQNKKASWKPEFPLNKSFNDYFQNAYGIYDRVPKGILEAIAYTQTRIRQINPKFEQPSCVSIPLPTGVMGLFEDGKNYFRSNFDLVQKISGYKPEDLRNDPKKQILAYAKTYQTLLEKFHITSNNIQDHIPVLIALSELPTASLLEDFAMDSYIYAVLSIWLNEDFAKEMLYEPQPVNLQDIFGQNYFILSASYVKASEEKVQAGDFVYNPYLSASHKTQSTDYPPAIWDPTTCNYSSRNGTAITHYTIHTVQGTYSGCISWFKNCSANASAHYVIRSSDGQVTQMISEANKAWHVGSENPYTIGTEHEGYVSDPAWYTTAMYNSSADLARDIINSGYGISGLRTYDKEPSSGLVSTGACIKIKGHQHYPNQTHTDPGINWNWAYFYTLVNNNPTVTTLTNTSGTVTDPGGNPGNYGNDVRQCIKIVPPNASKISLTFTTFDLEANYDFLWVFDGDNPNAPLIGKYSGSTLPPTLTANSGKMFLDFRTDCATVKEGFAANYSATVVDNTPPTTAVNPISGYKTTDFAATFSDNDNVAATTLMYLPIYYTVSQWTANTNNGFFFDEFNVLNGWTSYTGSWAIANNALNQSNATLDNTNLYAACTQNNNSSWYLYHFTMNIGGTGTNRRAGLHFFCDNANLANRGNSYFVFFRPDQSKIQIYETINDVFNLRSDISHTVPANTNHDVKILYSPINGTIKVYLNNNFVGQWIDTSPLTSGNYISFRTGLSNTIFDNLRVYKSRANNTVTVTVGSATNKDILNSNVSPTSNACRIFSIVKDDAEFWSNVAEGSVAIDFTVPTTISTVNDGTGADIATTTNGTQLSANWTASSDPNSGLLRYEYAIGTSAGATNIVNWTNNGTATSVTRTGLSLTNGTTYYFSVRAVNNAGLISGVKSSNGQTYQASTCGSDAFESNNTMGTAYSTATGVNRSGLICPQGDIDWFKFSNSSTYPHIRVSLTNLPLDYDIELYNSAGTKVGSSYNSGTNSEVIIYNNAPVGTYYVKIYGYNNAFHASSTYTFLAQRWSSPWTSKMDNDMLGETSVEPVALLVYPNPVKSTLFIEYSSEISGNAIIKVFNLQGQLVKNQEWVANEGSNSYELDVNELTPGVYFIEIQTENHEPQRSKFVKSE